MNKLLSLFTIILLSFTLNTIGCSGCNSGEGDPPCVGDDCVGGGPLIYSSSDLEGCWIGDIVLDDPDDPESPRTKYDVGFYFDSDGCATVWVMGQPVLSISECLSVTPEGVISGTLEGEHIRDDDPYIIEYTTMVFNNSQSHFINKTQMEILIEATYTGSDGSDGGYTVSGTVYTNSGSCGPLACNSWDLTGSWIISGTCEDDPSTPEVETSIGIVSQDDCDLDVTTSANTACDATISGNTIISECLPDDNDPPVICSTTILSDTSLSGTCTPIEGGPSCTSILERCDGDTCEETPSLPEVCGEYCAWADTCGELDLDETIDSCTDECVIDAPDADCIECAHNCFENENNCNDVFNCLENNCPCSDPIIVVNYGNIVIDGNYDDWQIDHRVHLDNNGADCNNVPGRDIQEVYLAQDATFIYLRIVLNGPLDKTFRYMLGNGDRIVTISENDSGILFYFGNAYGNPQPSINNDFLSIGENQFECKFLKSDIRDYWEEVQLNAWCDQGPETICRDHIDLGIVDFQ